jgi:hypothetical protein
MAVIGDREFGNAPAQSGERACRKPIIRCLPWSGQVVPIAKWKWRLSLFHRVRSASNTDCSNAANATTSKRRWWQLTRSTRKLRIGYPGSWVATRLRTLSKMGNSCRSRQSSIVEHRSIQYQVVQTVNPTGFRWTVQLDSNRTRTGTSSSKGNAIFRAVCLINTVVAKAKIPDAAS